MLLGGMLYPIRKWITTYNVDWEQGENMVDDIVLHHKSVQDQGRTSNCWAYSLSSFVESELLKRGNEDVCVDPMYFVERKPHPERHGGIPQLWLRIYGKHGINKYKTIPIPVDDFIVLTSFAHHRYHDNCVLHIPDNYEDDVFYNIPIDSLILSIYNSIKNGHSVVWEGDVHESGFSTKKGLGVLASADVNYSTFRRMTEYLCHLTTDDHMMHIVGTAHNDKGQRFLIAKNSVGAIGRRKGYVYLSEEYVRAKTIAITMLRQYVVQ